MPIFFHRFLSLFLAAAILLPVLPAQAQSPGPLIHDITTNLGDYAGSQVPRFEKLEITFQVDTSAANLQMPFDAHPPAGIQAGMGISVDALFSADGWQTVTTQPAFYYQGFLDEVKGSREWFYPSGSDAWKVRFAPDRVGAWQYKLRARDRSGISETPAASFTVAASAEKGPLRVSPQGPALLRIPGRHVFPCPRL